MKLPKSFTLGGTTWKVSHTSHIPDAFGETHLATSTVLLNSNKDISKDALEHTFCHELVHCILFAMGKGQKEPHDEEFVDLFGTFLHQYLKTAR